MCFFFSSLSTGGSGGSGSSKAIDLPVNVDATAVIGVTGLGLPSSVSVEVDLLWLDGEDVRVVPFLVHDEPSLPPLHLPQDRLAKAVSGEDRLHFLTFSTRHFDLAGLIEKCDVMFLRSSQLASFVDQQSILFVRGREGDAHQVQPLRSDGVVGVATIGASFAAEELSMLARRLFRFTHTSGFTCDKMTQADFFIPRNCELGVERPPPVPPAPLSLNATTTLPIFTLGTYILPKVSAPLRIFEPRYRWLVKQSLDGVGELKGCFGMIHPDSRVGTLVFVSKLNRIRDDGTSDIVVTALQRFKLVEERDMNGEEHAMTPDAMTFGLNRALVVGLEDVPIQDEDLDEALALQAALKERVPLRGLSQFRDPTLYTVELAFWLSSTPEIAPEDKLDWVQELDTMALLRRLANLFGVAKLEP